MFISEENKVVLVLTIFNEGLCCKDIKTSLKSIPGHPIIWIDSPNFNKLTNGGIRYLT